MTIVKSARRPRREKGAIRTRRYGRRLAVAASMGFITAALLAPSAQAASWHNVAGSVFSNTNWYYSTNYRTKAGTGTVNAEFSNLISVLPLRFGTVDNRGYLNGSSDFSVRNNEQQVSATLVNGEQFRNAYRRVNACSSVTCDHSFSGRELY